jgi:hypothetical protein
MKTSKDKRKTPIWVYTEKEVENKIIHAMINSIHPRLSNIVFFSGPFV